jgi:hypothetical protein
LIHVSFSVTCNYQVVDEAGSGALVVRFLDASQETVLLPLHRLRPNPVVARRQQRAAAAAEAVAHEASYGEDGGGRGVREMSQDRAAPAPYHPQASSSKPPPQNVGSNPFKSIKKKQKSGKKGNRGPPQGAKSIDEPRAVGFATRGQVSDCFERNSSKYPKTFDALTFLITMN